MYENGKMILVDTIPNGRREYWKMMEVNSTVIYCSKFCTCPNVPQAQ
jgi:hypothetical protein